MCGKRRKLIKPYARRKGRRKGGVEGRGGLLRLIIWFNVVQRPSSYSSSSYILPEMGHGMRHLPTYSK